MAYASDAVRRTSTSCGSLRTESSISRNVPDAWRNDAGESMALTEPDAIRANAAAMLIIAMFSFTAILQYLKLANTAMH